MVNVIIILLPFIHLTLGNDVMSPSELIVTDKNNHAQLPLERYTMQATDREDDNQSYDDEDDNYNGDHLLGGHRININGQLLDKLNDLQRAAASESRGLTSISPFASSSPSSSPWSDLSAASSNSKSNGHQGFFQ